MCLRPRHGTSWQTERPHGCCRVTCRGREGCPRGRGAADETPRRGGTVLVNRCVSLREQPLGSLPDAHLGRFGPFCTAGLWSVIAISTVTSSPARPVHTVLFIPHGDKRKSPAPAGFAPQLHQPRAPVPSAPSRPAPLWPLLTPEGPGGSLSLPLHGRSPRSELSCMWGPGRGARGQLTPGAGPERSGCGSFFCRGPGGAE